MGDHSKGSGVGIISFFAAAGDPPACPVCGGTDVHYCEPPIDVDALVRDRADLMEALARRVKNDKCLCFLINDANCTYCLDTALLTRLNTGETGGGR